MKCAGKARNNGLYRHIRTSKEIIRNLLNDYTMRMCYGSKTGYSTAVAMIMFLIVLIPVLISLRLTRTRD